jgi:hypothetical protein
LPVGKKGMEGGGVEKVNFVILLILISVNLYITKILMLISKKVQISKQYCIELKSGYRPSSPIVFP